MRALLYLFFLISSSLLFSQKISCSENSIGQVLYKSYISFNDGDFQKSQSELEKVMGCKNLEYFSYNKYFSQFLEVMHYNKHGKYDESLDVLNSMSNNLFFFKSKDSLAVETLYLKFGKKKVLTSFKNIKEIKTDNINPNIHSTELEGLNFTFIFNSQLDRWSDFDENGNEIPRYIPEFIINEKLDSLARFNSFYMILKE